MLGSGRPFLVEVSNARSVPTSNDICEMAEKINASDNRYVSALWFIFIAFNALNYFLKSIMS